jgi:hypothetical protein
MVKMGWFVAAGHAPAERDATSGIADCGMSIIETPELSNVVG